MKNKGGNLLFHIGQLDKYPSKLSNVWNYFQMTIQIISYYFFSMAKYYVCWNVVLIGVSRRTAATLAPPNGTTNNVDKSPLSW